MSTVVVIGASGFVGATVVESLLAAGPYDVRPMIHSSGNAWRLARRGIELFPADLLDTESVQGVIRGCEYVVNCSRGSSEVMSRGLKHLLQACRAERVGRFVHVSSTAVYGDRFEQPLVNEQHPVRASRASYGGKKVRQDEMVERAARRGLPCVVVCPPNITGPSSPYLLEFVKALRDGTLSLVEGGTLHCTTVDVRNLARAIECALTAPAANGERIIVADDQPQTWRDLVDPLQELVPTAELASVARSEAERLAAPPRPPRKSVLRALKHLASSDVRGALRSDPLWDSLHAGARNLAGKLPNRVQNWLRHGHANGTVRIRSERPRWNVRLIEQQLRNVRFVSERAADVLHYTPVVDFDQSSRAFNEWYREHFGLYSEFADLLALLG